MKKIATPKDLAKELRSLLAYAESENPSREKIASVLSALAGSTTKVASGVLDTLADKYVGDNGSPNLFFVSDRDECLAIFKNERAAREMAGFYGSKLEDRKTGEIWSRHGKLRTQDRNG
jgi:hypothetical protein